MRIVECKFNPRRDCSPVDQDGFVDLVTAFKEGIIPSGINVNESVELPCEESEGLLPPPSDVFESIQQVHTVRELADNSKSDDVD